MLKAYVLAQQTQEPEASEYDSEVLHALSPSATSGWDGADGNAPQIVAENLASGSLRHDSRGDRGVGLLPGQPAENHD